jgi:hypothetical protein
MRVSDDLERLLRDVPARVPSPDPAVTRRVRERLLGFRAARRRRISAGVLVALVLGMALGYWAIPQEEPAIGAADPPQVSIAPSQNVTGMYDPVEVKGRIVARKAGEQVTLEENVCGRGWTQMAGDQTTGTGEFTFTLFGVTGLRGNTMLRARWGSNLSNVVRISVRASVMLRQKSRRLFKADVVSFRSLFGRTAHLERYRSGQWRVVARGRLRDQGGGWTEVVFGANLPKGTIVRAVVPLSQARPCHLAGFSNMLTVAG